MDTMEFERLNLSWYLRTDVVAQAEELIGKVICTNINGQYCSGIITETEAYEGEIDQASHAFGGRRTARTETMYQAGGIAYIYLCYGMHHLFNVVTASEGIPHAILIRGIHPLEGFSIMQERRKGKKAGKNFSAGPATAAQALGLNTSMNGTTLLQNSIWIEDRKVKIPKNSIEKSPRIGVDYAGEHAQWLYRFLIKDVTYPLY